MRATADLDAVEQVLARYGALTRGAARRFLDDESNRAPYLHDLVADYPSRGGKAIRPSIILATCQAFGGSVRDAMGPAVSIELLHNAFLIHDDIEDSSELRRGAPTLHQLHGIPLAVNAGDALAMMALRPLRDQATLGSRLQEQVFDEFLSMTQKTIEGQAKELGWRRDNVVDIGPDDYLELIGLKTCWYTTIYPLRVGAVIGSRGTADLERLTRFGFYLGAAFQIRDDLLNLIGSPQRIGKELLGDLREGKRTLMLIHALEVAPSVERRWIEEYLAAPLEQRSDEEVHRLLGILHVLGSIDFAVRYSEGIATAAYDWFETAFAELPSSEHKVFLRLLVPYMLERDY